VQPSAPSAPVVAIGGSVGALPAFTELLAHVPGDTGMAFVFLQHLDPRRDSLLVELLRAPSRMPVREVEDAMSLEPNEVYVIPSAHDAAYLDGCFKLGPRRVPAAPSVLIDGFMQSLALANGSRAVGVVLSGNGRDGVEGLTAIRRAGGVTFCQRPATARSDAMPRAAMAAGVVDFVLDPEEIALELVRVAKSVAGDESSPTQASVAEQTDLDRLFALVRAATGVDFADYKRATVRRRIERRMRSTERLRLSSYVEHARADPREVAALHADLLIGVTSFFRDTRAFAALKRTVLPALVQSGADQRALRIWVAGCATGQEPYSIAMCLLECLDKRTPEKAIQIFATDVREAAIAQARAGVYPESIGLEMSSERLRRFFVKHADGYQISHSVRDLCIFARHDVICDPAFSNLDLITCRNLLIYLGPEVQKRVLSKFRQALRPEGMLLLGGSESVSSQSPLFERLDHQDRLYKPRVLLPGLGARPEVAVFASPRPLASSMMPGMGYDACKEADRVLLGRFVSAAILVDSQLQVIQFRGRTGPFMGPLSGAASLNVLKLVEEALLPAVRYGIASVQRTKRTYRRQGFVVQLQGVSRELDLEILPLRAPQSSDLNCLIVFGDAPRVRDGGSKSATSKGVSGRLLAQMREELAMTRDHLQASLTEQESMNEALRSTLEELQSTNEELQVTNEELETGKEELQSANEELMTASDAVQMRNAELTQLIHDHVNLVAATNLAAVLFGCDLHLRRVTPVAANWLQLGATDIGRPFDELPISLQGCDLAKLLAAANNGLAPHNVEAYDSAGRHYTLAFRPYRSIDDRADGVVMTISDITPLRAAEEALTRAEQRISALEASAAAAKVSN
jgi:two-component system CheB/CheR fusion protein